MRACNCHAADTDSLYCSSETFDRGYDSRRIERLGRGVMSKVKSIIMIIVFVVCLALVIIGQRNIGMHGLVMEMVGLVGLLTLLFVYNHQYK